MLGIGLSFELLELHLGLEFYDSKFVGLCSGLKLVF